MRLRPKPRDKKIMIFKMSEIIYYSDIANNNNV